MTTNIYAFVADEVSCQSVTEPYKENLNNCISNSSKLNENMTYYQNLSLYYKNLYENREINTTNREIIILNQQINNLDMTINDIKNELSLLKLTLKVTIPIFSLTLASLFGFSIYFRKKLRK